MTAAHDPGAPAIAWLRRDLRVDDNPALAAALAGGEAVVPLFVRDPVLLDPVRGGDRRRALLDAALVGLDARLRAIGGRLIVRDGRPEEVVPAVAREVGAQQVHAARDVTSLTVRGIRRAVLRPGIRGGSWTGRWPGSAR